MPPRASAKSGVKGKPKSVAAGDIDFEYVPDCPFPLWNEDDLAKIKWGDGPAGDKIFEDHDMILANQNVKVFEHRLRDWRRPEEFITETIPTVVRRNIAPKPSSLAIAALNANNSSGSSLAGSETTTPPFLASTDFDNASISSTGSLNVSSLTEAAIQMEKYKEIKYLEDCGPHSEAFSSAVSLLNVFEHAIIDGNYAWELIYPKQESAPHLPKYNALGKYVVKLYYMNAYRMVVVDDRLPIDHDGKCLFPLTNKLELWPALLMKAMLKVARGNEDLLFGNSMWCFSLLNSGLVPRTVHPASRPLKVLRYLSKTTTQSNTIAGKMKKPVLCAKCMLDGHTDSVAIELDPSEYEKVGLNPKLLYAVTACKMHKGKHIVRLMAYKAEWKGDYSYQQADLWTAEFEEEIGFALQDRLTHPNNVVNDFWMPFDLFKKYFCNFFVFQRPEYPDQNKKHLYATTLKNCKKIFLNVKCEEETSEALIYALGLVKFHGADHSRPSSSMSTYSTGGASTNADVSNPDCGALKCTVESYRWSEVSPYKMVYMFETPENSQNSIRIPLHRGVNMYRISFEVKDENRFHVQVMCKLPYTLGNLDDALKENGISVTSDQGSFPAPTENQWMVLFKNGFTVTQETTLSCELVLQENKEQFQQQSTSARPPSVVPADFEDASGENHCTVDELLPFVTVFLVDNDTLQSHTDLIGRLPATVLSPNTSGYSLVGCVKVTQQNKQLNGGSYTVRLISDRPIAPFTPIKFPARKDMEGRYKPNKESIIFKYFLQASEVTSLSLHITLSQLRIPFTLSLKLNDDIVFEKANIKHQYTLPNLTLTPSEKGKKTPNVYCLSAVVEPYYARQLYKHYLMKKEHELYHETEHGENGNNSNRNNNNNHNHDTNHNNGAERYQLEGVELSSPIEFKLVLLSNSEKLKVTEDTQKLEEFSKVKAQWEKKQPGRLAKGRDARERFLAEIRGESTTTTLPASSSTIADKKSIPPTAPIHKTPSGPQAVHLMQPSELKQREAQIQSELERSIQEQEQRVQIREEEDQRLLDALAQNVQELKMMQETMQQTFLSENEKRLRYLEEQERLRREEQERLERERLERLEQEEAARRALEPPPPQPEAPVTKTAAGNKADAKKKK